MPPSERYRLEQWALYRLKEGVPEGGFGAVIHLQFSGPPGSALLAAAIAGKGRRYELLTDHLVEFDDFGLAYVDVPVSLKDAPSGDYVLALHVDDELVAEVPFEV